MKILSLIVLTVVVAYIEGQLSQEQKDVALDEHNKLRNKLGWKDRKGSKFTGNAMNMHKLTWDDDLEQVAQEAADQCERSNLDHTGPAFRRAKKEYGSVGENLYWTGGYSTNPDVTGFVGQWYSEVKNYRWSKQNCWPSDGCLAFTQVIWADTEAVGCAMAECQWKSGKKWTNFVCEYGPAGNTKGQKPFETTDDADQICTKTGMERDVTYDNLCV